VFRERRQERRGEREADHYRMRQKLVSIGGDYWIENDRGERVYKVDGKALRLRKTLIFEDARGAELVKIQEGMLHVRDTMEIEDRDGNRVAVVKKALITPLRDRWAVKLADGPDLGSRATSSTTRTPLRTAAPRWRRCPRGGSGR